MAWERKGVALGLLLITGTPSEAWGGARCGRRRLHMSSSSSFPPRASTSVVRRVYLSVPYEEKDVAKERGALWDPERKRWFYSGPASKLELFEAWLGLSDPVASFEDEQEEQERQLYADGMVPRCDDKGQPITYLWVPLDENAEVRARGAKFDRLACAWYVPDGSLADFGRWHDASRPVLTALEGEDRRFGGRELAVQPVPDSSRALVLGQDALLAWQDRERLRRLVKARAAGRCELCQAAAPLDMLERWSFDWDARTQTLKRVLAACNTCARVSRLDLPSTPKVRVAESIKHLGKVRGMRRKEAEAHIYEAEELRRQMSEAGEWALDLGLLTRNGLMVSRSRQGRNMSRASA